MGSNNAVTHLLEVKFYFRLGDWRIRNGRRMLVYSFIFWFIFFFLSGNGTNKALTQSGRASTNEGALKVYYFYFYLASEARLSNERSR